MTIPQAIRCLQGFGRCCLARKKLISRAKDCYRRVFDEESGWFYYTDVRTGESTWKKPSFFLSNEPMIYDPNDLNNNQNIIDNNSKNQTISNKENNSKKQINPRTNRIL